MSPKTELEEVVLNFNECCAIKKRSRSKHILGRFSKTPVRGSHPCILDLDLKQVPRSNKARSDNIVIKRHEDVRDKQVLRGVESRHQASVGDFKTGESHYGEIRQFPGTLLRVATFLTMPEPKPITPSTTATTEKDGKEQVAPPSAVTDIKTNAQLIERAVSTLEPRFTHRVLRSLTTLRRRLDATVLRDALTAVFPKGMTLRVRSPWTTVNNLCNVRVDSLARGTLAAYLPTASADVGMDVDVSSGPPSSSPVKTSPLTLSEPSPEVDTYFSLLFTLYLIDSKNIDRAIEIAHHTAEKIHNWNRRTLDPMASKIYFYLSRAHEIQGNVSEIRPLVNP